MHELVDPIQNHRPLRLNDMSFIVGIKRPARESTAGRQTAQAIRKPARNRADIIVDQQPAAECGDHQVARAPRLGQNG